MVPQLPPLGSLPSTLEQALQPSNESRIITEPNEPFRIVHVNEVWCRVCGWDAEEALGQTCRIMQGLGTCKATLAMLRQALMLKRNFAVQLLNYTKRGRPFMNTLQVTPLFSAEGQVTHYLGVVMARFLDGGGAVPSSLQLHAQPAPLPLIRMDAGRNDFTMMAVGQPTLADAEDDGGGMCRVPPFLTKLSEILSSEPPDVVMLDANAAAFCIMDANKFAKEVLPRYFKHNKLGSFSQQLHTYGFRRKASAASTENVIEFYHDRYNGEPSQFLSWIRVGGALSKRAAHTREAPVEAEAPEDLLHDLLQIQEGTRQLARMFQQAKATHAMQLRTILTKLMLRGILAPESASYISALPPVTPILPAQSPYAPLGPVGAGPAYAAPAAGGGGMLGGMFSGFGGQVVRCISSEGLQAQLDALEAGLSPLTSGAFPMSGLGMDHSIGSFVGSQSIDLQGDEALNFFADPLPGGMRHNPYPVDAYDGSMSGSYAASSLLGATHSVAMAE